MINNKKLIIDGIKYLSENRRFHNATDKNDKYSPTSPAISYADTQMRIIHRVLDYISESIDNNDFHRVLMEMGMFLHKDIFLMFLQIWSISDREYKPIIISDEFKKVGNSWMKI